MKMTELLLAELARIDSEIAACRDGEYGEAGIIYLQGYADWGCARADLVCRIVASWPV